MLQFYNNVYKQINNKKQLNIIVLNLAKAFDTILYIILLDRLSSLQLQPNYINTIKA